MKTVPYLAMSLFVCVLRVSAAEPPPSEPIILDHHKVDAAFAKGLPLVANSSYKVQAGRRVAPGNVEIHQHDTDIFYITEGTATLEMGGTPVDPKESAPGELRANELSGGVPHQVTKGDVVVIPNGIPHRFVKVDGTFLYYVVKVTR